MLKLHKSVELLTGTIVGGAVLPHDGALSDSASLAEELLQLGLIDITRQVSDIQGLPVELILLSELLIGIPLRGNQVLLFVVRDNLVLRVLLGDLENGVNICPQRGKTERVKDIQFQYHELHRRS